MANFLRCFLFLQVLIATTIPQETRAVVCTNLDVNNDGNPDDCSGCPAAKYIQTNSSSSVCQPCPVGYFSSTTGSSSCTIHSKCSAGKYFSTAATSSSNRVCAPCSVGMYSSTSQVAASDPQTGATVVQGGGVSSCSQCPNGYYGTEEGNPSCTIHTTCSRGRYQTTAPSFQKNRGCSDCLIGKYTASNNQPTCSVCPSGRYQNEKATYSCKYCNGGKYLPTSNNAADHDSVSDCKICVAGKYASRGSPMCTICGAGYWQDQSTQSSCKYCYAGRFLPSSSNAQNHISLSQCSECTVGQFSSNGAGNCFRCTPGYYQKMRAQGSCSYCPGNIYYMF
jgi:hypothetical protein